ncbi:MAG: hypothetical protein HZB92_01475 [Euryarchaeota archaeon]|nr:hypothetical protein [Euryarchaeota archaeon]
MADKKHILVLCHTILHNAFRSDQFKREVPTGVDGVRQWLVAKFIADIIIELGSTGDEFACTSEKAFNEFTRKLGKNSSGTYVEALKSVIYRVPTESINKLDVNEGVIVIADTLCNLGNYAPFIVTDMRPKKIEVALDYYRKGTGVESPTLPFLI